MTDRTIFPHINKAGRYLGEEYNSIIKPWESTMARIALVFPDLYEIGMSHQGLQILYHILNMEQSVVAERCFCPDRDVEKLLQEKGKSLCTLESGKELKLFDIVAITLPYELCYTNILTILDLADIPFNRQERGEDHPIILGGGACVMNPEPVADFFDAFLLGDGEEAILEIAQCIEKSRENQESKSLLLERLEKIEGVYLPGNFSISYDQTGKIVAVSPSPGKPSSIRKRVLANLDRIDHLFHPLVANAKIVHDRLGVEVARGCTRGCRFCQAGITYRPVRERTPEQIMQIAREGLEDSGFDELALQSLSTGDYSCIDKLLPEMMREFSSEYVSVAMPSMRVGTLTGKIMEEIKKVRKTGFTLAPEAGSERLRRVINKGITEEDLLSTCEQAFSLGWKLIKLYFMIGLPTETQTDVEEITELTAKARRHGIQTGHGKRQIKVSIGTFVPKPHTPFQWHKQLSIQESKEKIFLVKDNLPKGCTLSYHSPKQSFLEGVFSRGDRRLSTLLIAAWQAGARLDAWTDHFNLHIWLDAAKKCGLDLDFYLRERYQDETLPWDHIETGVDKSFLVEEHQRALQEIYTSDCRYDSCHGCGLCDFETVAPVVHNINQESDGLQVPTTTQEEIKRKPEELPHFKYMVHYSKLGNLSYLGHLEVLQLVFRALKRAGIKTHYSRGFNPSPKISFSPALPVGTESEAEFFVMDLPEEITDFSAVLEKMNQKLPVGLRATKIDQHHGSIAQDTVSSYTVKIPSHSGEIEPEKIDSFLSDKEFFIERSRKGKTVHIDIRPMVHFLAKKADNTIEIHLVHRAGKPGIKPREAVQHIMQLTQSQSLEISIRKTGWRPLK